MKLNYKLFFLAFLLFIILVESKILNTARLTFLAVFRDGWLILDLKLADDLQTPFSAHKTSYEAKEEGGITLHQAKRGEEKYYSSCVWGGRTKMVISELG